MHTAVYRASLAENVKNTYWVGTLWTLMYEQRPQSAQMGNVTWNWTFGNNGRLSDTKMNTFITYQERFSINQWFNVTKYIHALYLVIIWGTFTLLQYFHIMIIQVFKLEVGFSPNIFRGGSVNGN